MNQSSKADVEKNLGDLSSRLGSISSLRDELTAFSAELNGDLSVVKISGAA